MQTDFVKMVYVANPIERAASPDFDLFSKLGKMSNKTLDDKIVRAPFSIDRLHTSYNSQVLSPTMHHFVTGCAYVYPFLLHNGALWDIGLMQSGICEMVS